MKNAVARRVKAVISGRGHPHHEIGGVLTPGRHEIDEEAVAGPERHAEVVAMPEQTRFEASERGGRSMRTALTILFTRFSRFSRSAFTRSIADSPARRDEMLCRPGAA